MKRIIPIIFLLQGLSPLLIFGCLTPSHRLYLVGVVVYTVIALGLWMAKRWALAIAAFITSLQIVTISVPSFSWSVFVGPTAGLLVALPLPQTQYAIFYRIGLYFTVAIGEPSASVQRMYSAQTGTFVLFNIFAGVLFVLLLAQFRKFSSQPLP